MKRAIVIGCFGQDGTLLTEHLIRQGYSVHGVARQGAQKPSPAELILERLDPKNSEDVRALVKRILPDEIYYLAGFHHSSEQKYPGDLELFRKSYEVNVSYPLHFLEAIRATSRSTRFFYASSSLIFGDSPTEEQIEESPYHPHSAYGITKLDGLLVCRFYREERKVFACAGILFNHESQYRPAGFLSHRIVRAVWDIAQGSREKLVLGSLSAEADWGYAPDYVDAMQRILLADEPGEFIIASGRKHRVSEFLEIAFGAAGLDWRDHTQENPALLNRIRRPIFGNFSRLTRATDWRPRTDFRQMVLNIFEAERRRRNG